MSSKKKASKQQKQQSKESKKATGGTFKRFLLLFFCTLVFFVSIDLLFNGKLRESYIETLVRKVPVREYSHKVLNKTSEGIRWINSEIDKQFPGYEKKLHETLEPYSELFSDLGFVAYKVILNVKESLDGVYENLLKKIEEYAPGLLDQTRDGIKSALLKIINFAKKSSRYIREEVFVGNLAPEHMVKVMLDLLHTAQQKVNEFYIWGYEKVRTVIK